MGIDYDLSHSWNRDNHGIRFAAVSQHAVNLDILGDFESQYFACCPECGMEVDTDIDNVDSCPTCGYTPPEDSYPGDIWYGEEPDSLTYDRDGYHVELDSHRDLIILRSPYVTMGLHASPCFPGGCTLPLEDQDGEVVCYALGPDWFESETAPYPLMAAESYLQHGAFDPFLFPGTFGGERK